MLLCLGLPPWEGSNGKNRNPLGCLRNAGTVIYSDTLSHITCSVTTSITNALIVIMMLGVARREGDDPGGAGPRGGGGG